MVIHDRLPELLELAGDPWKCIALYITRSWIKLLQWQNHPFHSHEANLAAYMMCYQDLKIPSKRRGRRSSIAATRELDLELPRGTLRRRRRRIPTRQQVLKLLSCSRKCGGIPVLPSTNLPMCSIHAGVDLAEHSSWHFALLVHRFAFARG